MDDLRGGLGGPHGDTNALHDTTKHLRVVQAVLFRASLRDGEATIPGEVDEVATLVDGGGVFLCDRWRAPVVRAGNAGLGEVDAPKTGRDSGLVIIWAIIDTLLHGRPVPTAQDEADADASAAVHQL